VQDLNLRPLACHASALPDCANGPSGRQPYHLGKFKFAVNIYGLLRSKGLDVVIRRRYQFERSLTSVVEDHLFEEDFDRSA
jgi:hypothetical protein